MYGYFFDAIWSTAKKAINIINAFERITQNNQERTTENNQERILEDGH